MPSIMELSWSIRVYVAHPYQSFHHLHVFNLKHKNQQQLKPTSQPLPYKRIVSTPMLLIRQIFKQQNIIYNCERIIV